MDFQLISQQIEAAYAQLSPQLKRAARHALDHPDDIALLSMRQFAAKADIHPSTMVRLVKVLGIKGYTAFQAPFRSRLRTRPEERFSKSVRSIQSHGTNSAHAMIDEMMNMEHANLDSILDSPGYDALSKCAKQIANARHVYVAGVRSSYPAAFYFQYACRMFEDNVSLLDGHGGTYADDLRDAGKDDILLAISFAPYSQSIVHCVEYAASCGAGIIALTDSTLSPLLINKGATPLIVRTSSPSLFHSVVPAMAVVQALTMLMIADGGKKVLTELSKSEAQLGAFDAYWSDHNSHKLTGG